jgi:hypothetical protein
LGILVFRKAKGAFYSRGQTLGRTMEATDACLFKIFTLIDTSARGSPASGQGILMRRIAGISLAASN